MGFCAVGATLNMAKMYCTYGAKMTIVPLFLPTYCPDGAMHKDVGTW